MKKKEKRSYRAPDVDVKSLKKQKLLEAQLLSLDAQVRNFGCIRDQLTADGQDAGAYYRKIQARRDEITKALGKFEVGGTSSLPGPDGSPFKHADEPLLALPIAPARFIRDLGIFGFGSSGIVQMATASECLNIVAHGKYPSSGEITTVPGDPPGVVHYSAWLKVGPESVPPEGFDPKVDYLWLHSWKYLVPFPPPPVESRLTYRFEVYATSWIEFTGDPRRQGMAMAFVSVGETGSLTVGHDVVPNIGAGWPFVQDLTQPGGAYNGHSGFISGWVPVQRSFIVPGKHVPAVAVVVGAIIGLSMMSQARTTPWGAHHSINVYNIGTVSYTYEPLLVAHQ
jgi:hypothetical protein